MPNLIESPADYPTPKGGMPSLDDMGRGNGVPIEGNEVILTVDLPKSNKHIIDSPGWSPK